MRFGKVTLGAMLWVTACSTAPSPPVAIAQSVPDTCNATRYGDIIGQDATALEKVLLLGMVRVIRPGDLVTQDFRPDRINFRIGADNRINDVSCG